ncbi:hypothetical protein MTsN2n4_28360 [Pseudoalteromonas sp. MTN2-4]
MKSVVAVNDDLQKRPRLSSQSESFLPTLEFTYYVDKPTF